MTVNNTSSPTTHPANSRPYCDFPRIVGEPVLCGLLLCFHLILAACGCSCRGILSAFVAPGLALALFSGRGLRG